MSRKMTSSSAESRDGQLSHRVTGRAQKAKGEDSARERRLKAAQRALAEARERRAAGEVAEAKLAQAQKGERNGRGGLDPVRYGDWEVKGIAKDF